MKSHAKRIIAVVMAAALAVLAAFSVGPEESVLAAGGAPKSITLSKKSVTLAAGERAALKVKSVKPKSASKKVTWKTSDKSVATVSAKGVVKAKKAGTATITARAAKGKALAKCKVKVLAASGEKKILVAYFSATGNTRGIAKKAAAALGADLCEITPSEPYTEEDLDYNDPSSRVSKESDDPDARPAIKGSVKDMGSYDAVLLGYPIWYGEAPRIINTFLESYDLSGKTIAPFCTSQSSGIGSSAKNLRGLAKDADWKEGRRFAAGASRGAVESWLEGIGLLEKEEAMEVFYLLANGEVLTADFADNGSARALAEKLKEGDVTIDAHDFSGFEKVGDLGFSLPTNDKEIITQPGDVILYQGNQLTVYYDENNWSLTRLGHIKGATRERLKSILGEGDVTITLTLSKPGE